MGGPGGGIDVADCGKFAADDGSGRVGGAVVGEGDRPGALEVGFEVRGVGPLGVALGVSIGVGEATWDGGCEGGIDWLPVGGCGLVVDLFGVGVEDVVACCGVVVGVPCRATPDQRVVLWW